MINHVPNWIAVLALAGVLGAAMSTANGGILAMSSVVSRNLLQRTSSARSSAPEDGQQGAADRDAA